MIKLVFYISSWEKTIDIIIVKGKRMFKIIDFHIEDFLSDDRLAVIIPSFL